MPRSRRLVLLVLLVGVVAAPLAAACQRSPGPRADMNAIIAPYRFRAAAWEACALLGIGCAGSPSEGPQSAAAPTEAAREEASQGDASQSDGSQSDGSQDETSRGVASAEASTDAAPLDIAALSDVEALETFFSLAVAQRALEERLWDAPQGPAEVRDALHAELAGLEAQRAALRRRVEATIARLIRSTLADEGISSPFGRALPVNIPFPPVTLRLDRPPTLLVVSPRERIESVREVMLVQGMPVETREEIEAAIADLGYSALVLDLGGLAVLYPPLIDEGASLEWTVETAVHEWLHQYLAFTPLGFRYVLDLTGVRPDYEIARMNETVAGMVGRELAQRVLEEYRRVAPPAPATEPAPPTPTRDRSLFNRTMRETRLRVDELLAAGRVDEAEAYMEAQRQYLASQGFYIRKLNQAYFAFHGTYADAPTSVDPIGEEMRALRRQVASPRAFLDAVSTLTSRADLQQLLAEQ